MRPLGGLHEIMAMEIWRFCGNKKRETILCDIEIALPVGQWYENKVYVDTMFQTLIKKDKKI